MFIVYLITSVYFSDTEMHNCQEVIAKMCCSRISLNKKLYCVVLPGNTYDDITLLSIWYLSFWVLEKLLLKCNSILVCFCSVANGNDSKKFKGDMRGLGAPSKVLHIRRLPSDATETEVIGLGLPFGDVTNLLMLKAKNQVRNTGFNVRLHI